MEETVAPDVTAVITALLRQAHTVLDDEPRVCEDDLGLRLANVTEVLAAAGFLAGDAWLEHLAMRARPWRASVCPPRARSESLAMHHQRSLADSPAGQHVRNGRLSVYMKGLMRMRSMVQAWLNRQLEILDHRQQRGKRVNR
jgi:hypothetical protein